MATNDQGPAQPSELGDVPVRRFWGDRQPPKNRADMFSARTVKAAASSDASTAAPATPGSIATLRMYGPIDSWGGWWGISAKDVSEALDALGPDVTEIRVRINSPGGEAWEGMAILNMLRAHPAKVVAIVDGLAASAASFIAAGCEETVMSPGTQMMIHDASGFAYGPASVMRKAATFLDSVSNSIASLYTEAAGGTEAEWRALMVEETWYTAQEAVDAGLADKVAVVADAGSTSTAGDDPTVDPIPTEGDVSNRFDLSIFNYAGRGHAPAPPVAVTAPHDSPTASADGSTPSNQEGATLVDFTDEQIATLREQVGFPENADAATITAAVTEALTERADDTAPVASASVPEGHIAVPAAALEELRANAQAGAAAARRMHEQERAQFLDEHRDRFLPANRTSWEREYDRDPKATRDYLAQAAVLVPLEEVGHDVPTAKADEDDSWFPGYTTPIVKEA